MEIQMETQIVKVVFWLLIVPFCCGFLPARGMKKGYRGPSMILVSGYFIMLAVFQVIYLGFVLYQNQFEPLVKCYALIICTIAFLSACLGIGHLLISRKGEKPVQRSPGKIIAGVILWIPALLLVGFQIYKTAAFQYQDGDDSFYAVTSVITNTNHNMYLSLPYTGETSVLDKRHSFSSAPIFISFIARVCGIHPTIVTHVIFSVAVLVLMYLIYKLIGDVLLEDNRELVPLFLIFINIMYLFGNDTIYMDSTFLLTRTGQGKAFLANIIPGACVLGLLLVWRNLRTEREDIGGGSTVRTRAGGKGQVPYHRLKGTAPWFLLGTVMMTAVYTSMMGAFYAPMLIGGGILLLAVAYRKIPLLVPCMLSMLPLLMVGLLYLKEFVR